MTDPFLQDIFPLQCKNDSCAHSYDREELLELLQQRGVVYADCGDTIYQGFSCRRCNHTTLRDFPRKTPFINLQSFIMQPSARKEQNADEQIYEIENRESADSHLKFQSIPAWDDELLSFEDIRKESTFNSWEIYPQPYVLDEKQLKELLELENSTGEIQFRRLHPDTPKFRYLFTLLNPFRYSIIHDELGLDPHTTSIRDIRERRLALQYFAEEAENKDIEQAITERMFSLECTDFPTGSLRDRYLKKFNEIFDYQSISNEIWELTRRVGWEDSISFWRGWEPQYRRIIDKVCEELSLVSPRGNLGQWLNKVGKGKALFIDAPMGLGKSYSIVDTLANNPELSAVIFFPTKELCQDITWKLKKEIAQNLGRTDWYEAKLDEFVNYKKRDYLLSEVFMTEGINEEECDFYKDITNIYKSRWFRKKDFCKKCDKEKSCRFVGRNWIPEARKARIIVTTHQLYNLFNKSSDLHKQIIGEEEVTNEEGKEVNKEITKQRDLFIVDEDLVLQQCYSPVKLSFRELSNFSSAFSEFLSDQLEDSSNEDNIMSKVDLLLGRICRPSKTALIPPIDLKFKIPTKIQEEWSKSYSDQMGYIPEYLDNIEPAANILDVVEHGIKYGVVLQKYRIKNTQKGEDNKNREVSEIFFPNPRFYDLSKCPPHVFFDGTKLEKKFLKKKVRGVKVETFQINIKPIWPVKVYQNTNSDLPKTKITKEKQRVENLLKHIFHYEGKEKKYYIHTTKAIRNAYLDSFIESENKRLNHPITVNHYGNLRGSNEGQDCEVHIMLGSYSPSDAVEIAMSLEFLNRSLKGKKILSTFPDIWTFQESNKVRTYKSEFKIIDMMSKALRHSEQRQALARTRCIFHSVDFYVVSKELVNEYESFLPKPEEQQYGSYYIPPTKQPNDKSEEVKKAILKYLDEHYTACDTEIHKATKIRRVTVLKYRKIMMEEGKLEMAPKSKTRYREVKFRL